MKAEGIELADNTVLSVKLHRFDRAQPIKSWYALLISIGNDEKHLINFNIGSADSLMITEMRPKWKIMTGQRKFKLPADFQIAKRNGSLIFIINGKVAYTTDDDPNHPFTELSIRTSSPNQADAVAIQIDPPTICKLK